MNTRRKLPVYGSALSIGFLLFIQSCATENRIKELSFATVFPIEATSLPQPTRELSLKPFIRPVAGSLNESLSESATDDPSRAGLRPSDYVSGNCKPGKHYLNDLADIPARWPLQSYPLAIYVDPIGLTESLAGVQRSLVNKAFEAWQGVGNGVGYIRFVDATEFADVHWRYLPLSGSRRGEASYWTDGGHFIAKAEVVLDPRMMRLDARDGDLRTTLASATHEVGHILGINGNLDSHLGHPNPGGDTDSIMLSPDVYRNSYGREVTETDTNTLRLIYCTSGQ